MTAVTVALFGVEHRGRDPVAALVLPAAEAAGHRHDVGVAEVLQRLGRERRAVAAGAVDDDRRVAVGELVLGLGLEVAPGDEHRAGDHSLLELVLLAHVEEGGVVEPGLGGLGIDLADVRLRGLQKVSVSGHTVVNPTSRVGYSQRALSHPDAGRHEGGERGEHRRRAGRGAPRRRSGRTVSLRHSRSRAERRPGARSRAARRPG